MPLPLRAGRGVNALYDLKRRITSFNVFEWLIIAAGKGATKIVFDARNMKAGKWDRATCLRRFDSICYPAPAFLGLESVAVYKGELPEQCFDPVDGAGGAPLVRFWNERGAIPRLRSFLEPRTVPYTVTLRKTERSPGRDSDEAVWRDFAQEIGAHVLPDYDVEPIHLWERMALYAGARMNFFVSNGPGVMCSLSEYPCMMFNTQHARGSLLGDGLSDGAQYPWMLKNQRTIWEIATPESLRRHFYHWLSTGTFGEDRYEPAKA